MNNENQGPQTLLTQTYSKKRVEKLRKRVMEEFSSDRLWILIYKGLDKKYSIFASNSSGGALPKDISSKVVKFAGDFINDEEADTDRRPEKDETLDIDVNVELS